VRVARVVDGPSATKRARGDCEQREHQQKGYSTDGRHR
jgi:hypothetical protein